MLSKFNPRLWYLWFRSRHFGRNATDIRYLLIEACFIGLLSALAALLLKQGVGWLGGIRVHLAHHYGAIWVLPLAGLILGGLAGWIIETFSPTAAGGGISQVKLALARYPIAMSLRVAVVKLIGSILILGAGLTLGRRAPTVHIGAALAAQLSHWLPTSPEHRRQMIAAGAAAGLAAGFTTPIAGVLFVVEELMRDVSGLTLETALVASFTGSVISLFLSFSDLNFPSNLLNSIEVSFTPSNIPFYLILGLLAGALGALFNRIMIIAAQWQAQINISLALRIGLTGLISGTIIAFLPPFFQDNSGLKEFLVTGELTTGEIAIAFIAHFFLTILAYSANAPGGIFAPALVLGSALGYLVGDVEGLFTGQEAQSTYALAGMGAFFTAVVRVPVTSVLLVFELNPNINLVLPLMITCAASYGMAESLFRGSIYEHLLEARGIHLSADMDSNDFMSQLTAADVMQSPVESLASDLTLEQVLQEMRRSHHRGFPIEEAGKLVGIITQTDIANASQLSKQVLISQVMSPNPITVRPDATLSDVLYLLNRYQISRLPVIEGTKILGIITRTDIIRIEAEKLSANSETQAKASPSYVVYQTRSPTIHGGRILLPLANPDTAAALIQIAASLARYNKSELEGIQVIQVPKYRLPNETEVQTQDSRKLLHRVERMGRHWHIPVHTQIRVAHDIAEAILDTIRERQITQVVMGWDGNMSTQGVIFGSIVDTLIRKIPCELVLVKLGQTAQSFPLDLEQNVTWLIPMAGGPNVEEAIALLPALTSLYLNRDSPQVLLTKVYTRQQGEIDTQELDNMARILKKNLNLKITARPICSSSVVDAIAHLAEAEQASVIMIGASRESLLQQVIHGNIPQAIARDAKSTVILFRGAL
jgi:CIC family chloride channel protein